MKKLLLVALFSLGGCASLPTPGGPAEPAHVSNMRQQFMKDVREAGLDPQRCSMQYLDSNETGHQVMVQCEEKPLICVVLIHPTEDAARPIACANNPGYKEPVEQKSL